MRERRRDEKRVIRDSSREHKRHKFPLFAFGF
jgi:hypothetical protein